MSQLLSACMVATQRGTHLTCTQWQEQLPVSCTRPLSLLLLRHLLLHHGSSLVHTCADRKWDRFTSTKGAEQLRSMPQGMDVGHSALRCGFLLISLGWILYGSHTVLFASLGNFSENFLSLSVFFPTGTRFTPCLFVQYSQYFSWLIFQLTNSPLTTPQQLLNSPTALWILVIVPLCSLVLSWYLLFFF